MFNFRLDPNHPIFTKLRDVLIAGLRRDNAFGDNDSGYVAVTEIGIRLIYALSIDPGATITGLVKDIADIMFPKSVDRMDVDIVEGTESEQTNGNALVVNPDEQDQVTQSQGGGKRKRNVNPSGFGDVDFTESLLYRYTFTGLFFSKCKKES